MEREREQGSDRLDTEERKELNDSEWYGTHRFPQNSKPNK